MPNTFGHIKWSHFVRGAVWPQVLDGVQNRISLPCASDRHLRVGQCCARWKWKLRGLSDGASASTQYQSPANQKLLLAGNLLVNLARQVFGSRGTIAKILKRHIRLIAGAAFMSERLADFYKPVPTHRPVASIHKDRQHGSLSSHSVLR